MLIIKNSSHSGYNDFFPCLNKIYVRDGIVVLYDWQTYRRWIPLLFLWDLVTLIFVCSGIYSHLLTGTYHFATFVAAAYLIGVGVRRTFLRRFEMNLNNSYSVSPAPLIAWMDSSLHGLLNFVIGSLLFLLASGYVQVFSIALPAFALIDLLLPFLNLVIYRAQPDST